MRLAAIKCLESSRCLVLLSRLYFLASVTGCIPANLTDILDQISMWLSEPLLLTVYLFVCVNASLCFF